jgi:hypothetical protein
MYQTRCLLECTQPGTMPVVMLLLPTSMNKTAFSSVQQEQTLCKYTCIITMYMERGESQCSDREIDKHSSILEPGNAVERHWMEVNYEECSKRDRTFYIVRQPAQSARCGY